MLIAAQKQLRIVIIFRKIVLPSEIHFFARSYYSSYNNLFIALMPRAVCAVYFSFVMAHDSFISLLYLKSMHKGNSLHRFFSRRLLRLYSQLCLILFNPLSIPFYYFAIRARTIRLQALPSPKDVLCLIYNV